MFWKFVASLSWRVLSQQKSELSRDLGHVLILVLTWQDLLRQNSCHREIMLTCWILCWHGKICCDISFIRREMCVFTCWRGTICYNKTLGLPGTCLFYMLVWHDLLRQNFGLSRYVRFHILTWHNLLRQKFVSSRIFVHVVRQSASFSWRLVLVLRQHVLLSQWTILFKTRNKRLGLGLATIRTCLFWIFSKGFSPSSLRPPSSSRGLSTRASWLFRRAPRGAKIGFVGFH